MSLEPPPTEQRNPASSDIDKLDAAGIVALMNHEEHRALRAVEMAAPLLAVAAERVASSFQAGGRTVFIGAGTSGRIAAQEVAELPPTFGVQGERFVALAAGNESMGPMAITRIEDDVAAAPRVLAEMQINRTDVVIGIAASGTTPFVRAGLQSAAKAGSWTCGLANNPDSPIFDDAELGILLDTGPEILTGSTRLKAGTAQKLALNRITTAAMILAGRVIKNYMVDLTGSNLKFRQRSVRIIMDLVDLDEENATLLLADTEWSVRRALQRSAAAHSGRSRN
jgi:N-acetylmuramic acid 6-phosphate etherase